MLLAIGQECSPSETSFAGESLFPGVPALALILRLGLPFLPGLNKNIGLFSIFPTMARCWEVVNTEHSKEKWFRSTSRGLYLLTRNLKKILYILQNIFKKKVKRKMFVVSYLLKFWTVFILDQFNVDYDMIICHKRRNPLVAFQS